MPVKRRRIEPWRINPAPPAWATRLLAGELPAANTPESVDFLGWKFFGDMVPGLPDPYAPEGRVLWDKADAG